MGYVLFFAYYGRMMKNVLYEDLASELLDEILEELHEDWSLSLENGLCGIGWGIEYLIQHDFMEGCTDEILKDIDFRIMEWDPRRIKDLSLRKGIGGILYYVAIRLSSLRPMTCKPFDSIYLHDLLEAILQNDFSHQEDLPTNLLNDLIHILKEEKNDISSISDHLWKMILDSYLNIPVEWEIPSSLALRDYLGKCLSNEKRLYLIKDENPSGNYGIGTYISQICEAMGESEWKVIVVTLRSSRTSTISIEKKRIYFI